MGKVNATVACRYFRKFDDFVCRSKPVGYVLQRRTQTERAFLHGLRHEQLHLFQLRCVCRTIILSDHVIPDGSGAYESAEVNCWTRTFIQSPQVIAERAPVLRDA